MGNADYHCQSRSLRSGATLLGSRGSSDTQANTLLNMNRQYSQRVSSFGNGSQLTGCLKPFNLLVRLNEDYRCQGRSLCSGTKMVGGQNAVNVLLKMNQLYQHEVEAGCTGAKL